jgi:hypothetical protein
MCDGRNERNEKRGSKWNRGSLIVARRYGDKSPRSAPTMPLKYVSFQPSYQLWVLSIHPRFLLRSFS